jgi:hypothetical protein
MYTHFSAYYRSGAPSPNHPVAVCVPANECVWYNA